MRTRSWLAALALSGTVACGEDGETPLVAEDILQLNAEANQVVIGLEHYVTTGGVRRAHIVADTAFFLEDKSLVELRVMQVTFYDARGQVSSILTARDGTYDWSSGDMIAERDVVVLNPREERRVETSVMHYDSAEERIWSDAATKMFESDGTVVEGTAFTSDSGMDQVELTSARLVKPAARPTDEQ